MGIFHAVTRYFIVIAFILISVGGLLTLFSNASNTLQNKAGSNTVIGPNGQTVYSSTNTIFGFFASLLSTYGIFILIIAVFAVLLTYNYMKTHWGGASTTSSRIGR